MDTQILLDNLQKRTEQAHRARMRARVLAVLAIVLSLAALLAALTGCSAPTGILRPTATAPAPLTSDTGKPDTGDTGAPRSAFSLRVNSPTLPAAPQKESRCTVTAHALTLRAAPNATAAPLAWLAQGDTVTVTLPYPTGAWLAVDTANLTGFVNANYLTCEVTK